ncbi:hypothetical protein P3T73_02870 [Kiritimatiellota bacterium B12222]|nr:hypothetical protein P3T73_02870 [Kiritimatiellota bacterium B12222]
MHSLCSSLKLALALGLSLLFSTSGLAGLSLCIGDSGSAGVEISSKHTSVPVHLTSDTVEHIHCSEATDSPCFRAASCVDIPLFLDGYPLVSFSSQKLICEPALHMVLSYQDILTDLPIREMPTYASFDAPNKSLPALRSMICLRI